MHLGQADCWRGPTSFLSQNEMQKITECAALLAHGRRQNIRPRSKGLAYECYEVDLLMNARATRDDLRAPLLDAAAAAGVLAALAFEVAPRVPACHSAHSLWRQIPSS